MAAEVQWPQKPDPGKCVDDGDDDLLYQSNGDCLKVAAPPVESQLQMSQMFCDGRTDRGVF